MCESTFPTNVRAIKHYNEIHLHCTYICGICVKYFHKKENFDSHCATEHPDGVALPVKGPEIAKRSKQEKAALMSEFNQKRCLDCKFSFANITEITEHFRSEHQFEMNVCMKCEKAFTVKNSLKYHVCRGEEATKKIKIHKKGSEFMRNILRDFRQKRCTHCQLTFTTPFDSSKHFLLKHGTKILICTKCDKGYTNVRNFKYHLCSPPKPAKSQKVCQSLLESFFKSAPANTSKYLSHAASDDNDCSIVENGDETIADTSTNSTSMWVAKQNSLLGSQTGHAESKCDGDGTKHLDDSAMNIKECSSVPSSRADHDSEAENSNDSLEACALAIEQALCNTIYKSTPKPSNASRRGRASNAPSRGRASNAPRRGKGRPKSMVAPSVITEAQLTVQTFTITDTESEASNHIDNDVDSDVQILEWNPGTDVKPVIKLEKNMDWN